jgi:beta-lactamase superfamily II metal-dependent hydrolase
MIPATAPAADEIEITLFGPGYGESIVIHAGDNNWIIVDSCVAAPSKEPVALDYLDSLNIPADAVKLIVATHWHDDHIRGISRLVEKYPSARFALSAALDNKQFLQLVSEYGAPKGQTANGTGELFQTLSTLHKRLKENVSQLVWAGESTVLYRANGVTFTALAPSNLTITNSKVDIARKLMTTGSAVKRLMAQGPNDMAVAASLEVGNVSVLLGADLEEQGNVNTGWSGIIACETRSDIPASLYKVAHHGSITAHHEGIWSDLLVPGSIAIVTPFNRSNLPRSEDRERLAGLASAAYVTSTRQRFGGFDGVVGKTIKEATSEIRPDSMPLGWVRARFNRTHQIADGQVPWMIEKSSRSEQLKTG